MAKLRKLTYNPDDGAHSCGHRLGRARVEVYIDASEESVPLKQLTEIAQGICDDWSSWHPRLAKVAARELVSTGRLAKRAKLAPEDCVPFYLRVYADPDGEVSYTVAFHVPSVLPDANEYVDVSGEYGGDWVDAEVCDSE